MNYALILSLSPLEHLNLTTLPSASIISPPVAGFRPRRHFFLDTEFAEAADQHIVSGGEGRFDQLKQNLDCFNSFVKAESVGLSDGFYDLAFREGYEQGASGSNGTVVVIRAPGFGSRYRFWIAFVKKI